MARHKFDPASPPELKRAFQLVCDIEDAITELTDIAFKRGASLHPVALSGILGRARDVVRSIETHFQAACLKEYVDARQKDRRINATEAGKILGISKSSPNRCPARIT